MQNRPRIILALIAAGAAAMLPAATPARAPQAGADVIVEVSNLRSDKGTVRACMTTNPKIFPRCRKDTASHRAVVPAGEAARLTFHNVQPGTYAIALLHDENDNGKADRALGMMPKEGFGFSRDAKVKMGPPDFGDAAIQIGTTTEHQTIRMRYIL